MVVFGVFIKSAVSEMRRIAPPDPAGWLLSGKLYRTEAEFQQARAARDERRARLLARIYAERGWDADDDTEDE